jgi:hypothetical protein
MATESTKPRTSLTKVLATGSLLALTASVFAGTRTFNFDTDPAAELQIFGNNPTVYVGTGGNPDTGGYISITDAVGGQNSSIIFPDIDGGLPVKAFTFTADLRVGNATGNDGRPADGFSINYARSGDPVLVAAASNPDGVGGAYAAGLPEAGTTTGIAIGFDVWSGNTLPDGGDVEGVIVRVDNVTVLRQPLTTRNGTCTDTNSIQTGPYNAEAAGDPTGLCWAQLQVDLDEAGKLTVTYKGRKVLDAFQTTFIPTPGRLVLAGRTGGANQNQHVDNVVITTIAAALPTVGPVAGTPDGFSFPIDDAGASVLNPATLVVTFNGTAVTPTLSKTGTTTTVAYKSPVPFTIGATNTVAVSFKDNGGNSGTGNRTFPTPAYALLAAADAASSPDTTKTGFSIRPHQVTSGQPNSTRFTEEQLAGLRGTNQIDLSAIGADAAGFVARELIDYKNASGGSGVFNTLDTPFSDLGIPGGALTTEDNSAFEAITYIEFPARGTYIMGVASDDGFTVKGGARSRDLFQAVAGVFEGGRGIDGTGTRFNVFVEAPGVYAFRLLWQNGGGGAAVEWFTLKADGTPVLLNDTANGGLKTYRAVGSASAPFVAMIQPYPGAAGASPIAAVEAWLRDGSAAIEDSSITLALNGTAGTPTVSRTGTAVKATLASSGLLPSGSTNSVVLTYKSAGSATVVTQTWTFVADRYATLPSSVVTAVGSGDSTKPGFNVKTWQTETRGANAPTLPNNLEFTEGVLAGLLTPNLADLTGFQNGVFAEATTINYARIVDETNGNFTPDRLHPGIPGTAGSTENYASEFTTFVEFPAAGYYRMGVNSDDNFRVTIGEKLGRQYLEITAPANVAGGVAAVASAVGLNANLGGPLITSVLSGDLVFLGTSCPADAALPDLTGKIAFIVRGGCTFVEKARKAQAAGAAAVVIGNSDANSGFYPIVMGGDGFDVTIPVMMIDNVDYNRLKDVAGLKVTVGQDTNLRLGEFNNNGRGASDTIFGFVAPQAGVYPIRCSYMQGGGGGNVEWFSVTASGERILLNDTTNPAALKAFRARTASPVVSPTLAVRVEGTDIVITYTGTLQSSDTVNTGYGDVTGTSPLRIPLGSTAAQKFYRARN